MSRVARILLTCIEGGQEPPPATPKERAQVLAAGSSLPQYPVMAEYRECICQSFRIPSWIICGELAF